MKVLTVYRLRSNLILIEDLLVAIAAAGAVRAAEKTGRGFRCNTAVNPRNKALVLWLFSWLSSNAQKKPLGRCRIPRFYVNPAKVHPLSCPLVCEYSTASSSRTYRGARQIGNGAPTAVTDTVAGLPHRAMTKHRYATSWNENALGRHFQGCCPQRSVENRAGVWNRLSQVLEDWNETFLTISKGCQGELCWTFLFS